MGVCRLCRVASRRVACCSIQPIRWASSRARSSGSDIQSVASVHGYVSDLHSQRTGCSFRSTLRFVARNSVWTFRNSVRGAKATWGHQPNVGLAKGAIHTLCIDRAVPLASAAVRVLCCWWRYALASSSRCWYGRHDALAAGRRDDSRARSNG